MRKAGLARRRARPLSACAKRHVAQDLSYTFNNVNQLTAISDSDAATYSAAVTCDANNHIT